MKKLISAFLTVVMLSGTLSLSAFAQNIIFDDSYILGDANGDKTVDAKDAMAIKRYIYSEGSYEIAIDASDIDNDGTVGPKDVLNLKKCLAGSKNLTDYESKTNVDKFTIAGNNISEYCIIVPADATEKDNIYYAANQLKQYVKVATGTDLPLCVGGAGAARAISFMDVTPGSEMETKLEIENYIYEVVGGDLKIYGTKRGNMYAVYEILEDYLGFRFYSDDETMLYETRRVDIPEGTNVFRRPALTFRYAGQTFNSYGVLDHYFPRRLNSSMMAGYDQEVYGTLTGPVEIYKDPWRVYWQMATGDVNAPTYEKKLYSGEYKYDWNWNPCFTSNDDYNILFRGMLETMELLKQWGSVFNKDTSSMSFAPCDNPTVCTCVNCRHISGDGVDKEGVQRLGAGAAGLYIYIANRAAKDIKTYYDGRAASDDILGKPMKQEYPDMKITTILYAHNKPIDFSKLSGEGADKLAPEDNLIIMFNGNSCNNHYLGSGECGDRLNNIGWSGSYDEQSLKEWGKVCKEYGAEFWFMEYAVNDNTFLTDSPNIFNLYYDFKYLVEECDVTGIYYGGDCTIPYMFQPLKEHLATMLMWDATKNADGSINFMSYDEFINNMKEYLKIYYGKGYEYIYQYIQKQDEAGNLCPCYVNNFDRPGDMFDYAYIRDNYEEMRTLLKNALDLATGNQVQRIEYLIVSCDFLGLSANYEKYYKNGTADQKNTYIQRYTDMYNYIVNNHMEIYRDYDYHVPETLDVSVNPMIAFYEAGSWNIKNKDTWGYVEPPVDDWVYKQ